MLELTRLFQLLILIVLFGFHGLQQNSYHDLSLDESIHLIENPGLLRCKDVYYFHDYYPSIQSSCSYRNAIFYRVGEAINGIYFRDIPLGEVVAQWGRPNIHHTKFAWSFCWPGKAHGYSFKSHARYSLFLRIDLAMNIKEYCT